MLKYYNILLLHVATTTQIIAYLNLSFRFSLKETHHTTRNVSAISFDNVMHKKVRLNITNLSLNFEKNCSLLLKLK